MPLTDGSAGDRRGVEEVELNALIGMIVQWLTDAGCEVSPRRRAMVRIQLERWRDLWLAAGPTGPTGTGLQGRASLD